jgi:N-acetylglucosaminyl-diphospho-decaprenol L-rhamnosyltransferase
VSALVDVVVVSYNSRDTLRSCVESLIGQDDINVIVVDNDSPDASLDAISDLPVVAIPAGRNGGFSFGCNIGLRAGQAPYVLFLNPDAQITPESVRHLAEVLALDTSSGLVGPRIEDADGTLFPSMRRYQRAGSIWATALFLHRFFKGAAWANEIIKSPAAYAAVAYPEWVSGACFLARRDILEAAGGFDEGFFLYNEDMDICARVRAAGHQVRYEPGVTARHEGGQSAPRTGLYAILAASRLRYARQHAGMISASLQAAGLAVGAATHVVANMRRPANRRGHAAALRALVAPAGGRAQMSGSPS